jgi:hypothetical protein
MAGPYDYTIQQPDITGSLVGGIKSGLEIGSVVSAQERHKQFSTDLQSHLANPSFKSTSELIAKYPEFQKSLSASFETLDKGQKDQVFKDGTQAIVAIRNGKPDVAKKILDDRITAYENSGMDTTDLVSLRSQLDNNPDAVEAGLGLTMASLNPEGWGKIASEERSSKMAPYELGKAKAESGIKQVEARYAPEREFLQSNQTRAETRNVNSQISERSRRFGLDEDRFHSEVDEKLNKMAKEATTLGPDATKLLNESVVNSIAADQSAGRLEGLAGQLEEVGGGYGAVSTAGEWLKKVGGFQNGMTDIRNEYARIRNSEAIKTLPPGPATDKDIELALQGIPGTSADSGTIVRFLRGMAKLSRVTAIGETAKSEWVNSVGNLGKPKNDIVIDGVNVPKGTTFQEFTQGYVANKLKQGDVERGQEQVPQRSYMRVVKNRGGQ